MGHLGENGTGKCARAHIMMDEDKVGRAIGLRSHDCITLEERSQGHFFYLWLCIYLRTSVLSIHLNSPARNASHEAVLCEK